MIKAINMPKALNIPKASRTQRTEQKIRSLKNDIKRFTRASRSEWSRPIDYVNLSDAQFMLKKLEAV